VRIDNMHSTLQYSSATNQTETLFTIWIFIE
jgi:hypothetical protein